MFRKTILSAALTVAAFAGVAAVPSSAEAAPFAGQGRPHFARFEVLVRHRGHWDRYATYRDRDDARGAARQLRHQGYEVRVERI